MKKHLSWWVNWAAAKTLRSVEAVWRDFEMDQAKVVEREPRNLHLIMTAAAKIMMTTRTPMMMTKPENRLNKRKRKHFQTCCLECFFCHFTQLGGQFPVSISNSSSKLLNKEFGSFVRVYHLLLQRRPLKQRRRSPLAVVVARQLLP